MITNEPDPTIDLNKLEQEIRSYQYEIVSSNRWYLREAYYDFGGHITPHYCIIFRNDVEDPGDNVMDAPLLETNRPELGYVNLTCFTIEHNKDYWQPVGPELLIQRLERFLTMNRENYLQPPVSTGDLYGASIPHPQFEGVSFLYQVWSPSRCITGIGPAMFTGAVPCGALRGQLLADDQSPLIGVTVELVLQQENNNNPAALTMDSGDNGLLLFSRVPAGTYNLKVHGQNRAYDIRLLNDKPETFGFVEELLIKVDAGRIHVLEIQARPVEEPGPGNIVVTGSLDIQFVGDNINLGELKRIYLISEDSILTYDIDNTSSGNTRKIIEKIPIGQYTVSLQLATIFFDLKSDKVNIEADVVLKELSEMLQKPVNSYISSLICWGYADINEGKLWGISRAVNAMDKLKSYGINKEIDTREGGLLGNKGEENSKYRRVDFYVDRVTGGGQN